MGGETIQSLQLFKINISAERKFSFGTWTSRQHVFVQVKTKNHTAWAENIISTNRPKISLEDWAEFSKVYKDKTLTEAWQLTRAKIGLWPDKYLELIEFAIIDLLAKEENQNALDYLKLPGRSPVPTVFVLLTDSLEEIKAGTKTASNRGYSHLKVKLFADHDLNKKIIRSVRAVNPELYLIGDVNCGYENSGSEDSLEALRSNLQDLSDLGLDACEDPAYLYIEEWEWVQSSLDKLSLIPDYPMRPSRDSIHQIHSQMGQIFNIHPGSCGSVVDGIRLGQKTHAMDRGLMIGDDSLIGPACSLWQQLAVGLSAQWVEVVEKDGDSDGYRKAVISLPTKLQDGKIHYAPQCTGFGLELDEEKLRQEADEILLI